MLMMLIIICVLAAIIGFALARRNYDDGNGSAEPSGPVRLWTRGNDYNYMECFRNPDGTWLYRIHRLYKTACPRCLEYNYPGYVWSAHLAENYDPLRVIKPGLVAYRCKRCGDIQRFKPELHPSEWYGA